MAVSVLWLTIYYGVVPKVLSGYAWSRALPKFEELEVLAEKIGQVAEAATKDVNVQYSLTTFNGDFSSDSGSDSSSYMSLGNFEDVVDDLKVYSGSLMDLTPSLENPASDFINVEESKLTLTEDLLNVVEPARPFVLIIKDRFPSANAGLVKKLGEANWQRRERLVKKLAENERMSILPLSGSDTTSAAGTVVGRSHHQAANDGSPRTSIVRSSMSFASNFQSITTASNFSEPSIFDSNSAYMPIRQQRLSVAESFTSFATSVAEGVDNGQRRLPSLPSDHDFDTSFKCKICGDMLRNISGRADWK